MKHIFFLLTIYALLGLSVCCAPPKPPKTPQQQEKELVESIQDKTVALVKLDEDKKLYPYCSGVWVEKDLILTALHCLKGEDIVIKYKLLKDKNLELRYAMPIKFDSLNDLLLLEALEDSLPAKHSFAKVASSAWVGEEVHIMGHPNGLWWTYFKGEISAKRKNYNPEQDDYQKLFQISAPVWMGNSGGGAFDNDGNLVGISSWIMLNIPSTSFFIHREAIEKFLKDKDGYKIKP